MVQASNGRFYRTIVNRIWAQLMGRGLIEPVDVMDNEAWSQDLLDWMAFNFQQNNSDIKRITVFNYFLKHLSTAFGKF